MASSERRAKAVYRVRSAESKNAGAFIKGASKSGEQLARVVIARKAAAASSKSS